MIRVDVVAAVRSEERVLPSFVESIRALPLPEGVELGLLFVEDSSDDETLAVLRRLAREDPTLHYWSLERGFGQGPAIVFGLSRSKADALVMMDADGSHPPEVIPEMIERFLAGARVVQCRRRSIGGRRRWRNLGSATFSAVGRWLTGVDLGAQNVYYRLVSADVARELVASPIHWRFLRIPLPTGPGELAMLEIDTRERSLGQSKYDFPRLLRMAIDGALSLVAPARLFGLAALGMLAAAALALAGTWPAAVAALLLVVIGWVLWRHRQLGRSDALARMRVVESTPAEGGGA